MLRAIVDSILNHKDLSCEINKESLIDDLKYILSSRDFLFYAILPCEKFVNLMAFTEKNYVDIKINNKEITSSILSLKRLTEINDTLHLSDQRVEVNIRFSDPSDNIRVWYPIEDLDVYRFVWRLKYHTIYA